MSKAWILPILLISIGSMIVAFNVSWNVKEIEKLSQRVERLQSIVDELLKALKETRR